MTLRDSDREALVKMFEGNEEEADAWLKNNVDPVNRNIAEIGQIARDAQDGDDNPEGDEATEEEVAEEEVAEEKEVEGEEEEDDEKTQPVDQEPELVIELTDEMTQQISDKVFASSVFTEFRDGVNDAVAAIKDSVNQLSTTVADLQAASVARAKDIDALKKGEAEKKREWLDDVPRNQHRVAVTYRPSKDASSDKPVERSMEQIAQETLANLEQ